MEKKLIAYTDGSYNSTTGYYGCGAVLIDENEQEIARMHKTGKPDAGANGWNINGEIEAAVMAIHTAIGLGCKELTIYHDYEGVGKSRSRSLTKKGTTVTNGMKLRTRKLESEQTAGSRMHLDARMRTQPRMHHFIHGVADMRRTLWTALKD